MHYLGEEKKLKLATECVYLVQRTMYGATVVGATMVGTRCSSGWCAEWCAVWCSISVPLVGVVSGVLYDASIVKLWLAQQANNVCAATVGATTIGVTCVLNGASSRAWLNVGALKNCPVARHTIRCMRNKARRCETLIEEGTMHMW